MKSLEGRVRVIAEVGQNHDGSLGQAHAFIDAVAKTGADVIKFQTHIAAAESSPEETFRVKFSRVDATRYDYWKRMEFTEEQWAGLKKHAEEKGLAFLSSPFSLEAVDLLERIGVTAWKIGSGEVNSVSLLERVARTKKPVFLSTGMSALADIDEAVAFLKARGAAVTLFQCTSAYPSMPESVGLNMIGEFKKRYGCPVGLSDHSGTIFPALAAAALGAAAVEVHVTLSRELFGPDVAASVTTEELALLVRGVRDIEKMVAHPVDKDAKARELAPLRKLFGKSAVAAQNIPAGTPLAEGHVVFRKPGSGIPEKKFSSLVGKKVVREIKKDSFLREEDLSR